MTDFEIICPIILEGYNRIKELGRGNFGIVALY